MKQIFSLAIMLLASLSIMAQAEAELKPNELEFFDQNNPLTGTRYGYNFFNIQSGFDFSSGGPGFLSAGDDLQFSSINKDGFEVTQTSVFDPMLSSKLDLQSLSFNKFGSGANGSTWQIRTVEDGNGDVSLTIEETAAYSGAAYLGQALHIQSTGPSSNNNMIGIGTSMPDARLHVEGTTNFRQPGIKRFYIPNWTPSAAGLEVIAGVFTGEGIYSPTVRFLAPNSSFADFGVDSDGNAIFQTGDVTRLTIFQNGNVNVAGSLSKGGGSFKIDHPLDPENKYLYHSFVESPDMMNVYNGNITTDAHGEATVTLPDYFEALNRDFRYQLTAVGTFTQLIIKEKLEDNSFVIASSVPNVEVSWQITGIRQDAFANKNRIPNEVDKKGSEIGTYLHPEAFNQPASKTTNKEDVKITLDH